MSLLPPSLPPPTPLSPPPLPSLSISDTCAFHCNERHRDWHDHYHHHQRRRRSRNCCRCHHALNAQKQELLPSPADVSSVALRHYRSFLPPNRGKPRKGREWTVYAAIVAAVRVSGRCRNRTGRVRGRGCVRCSDDDDGDYKGPNDMSDKSHVAQSERYNQDGEEEEEKAEGAACTRMQLQSCSRSNSNSESNASSNSDETESWDLWVVSCATGSKCCPIGTIAESIFAPCFREPWRQQQETGKGKRKRKRNRMDDGDGDVDSDGNGNGDGDGDGASFYVPPNPSTPTTVPKTASMPTAAKRQTETCTTVRYDQVRGVILHDSHAEVLARRGLVRSLWLEVERDLETELHGAMEEAKRGGGNGSKRDNVGDGEGEGDGDGSDDGCNRRHSRTLLQRKTLPTSSRCRRARIARIAPAFYHADATRGGANVDSVAEGAATTAPSSLSPLQNRNEHGDKNEDDSDSDSDNDNDNDNEGFSQYELRPGVSLHMYVSDSPCGDASIYRLKDTYATPGNVNIVPAPAPAADADADADAAAGGGSGSGSGGGDDDDENSNNNNITHDVGEDVNDEKVEKYEQLNRNHPTPYTIKINPNRSVGNGIDIGNGGDNNNNNNGCDSGTTAAAKGITTMNFTGAKILVSPLDTPIPASVASMSNSASVDPTSLLGVRYRCAIGQTDRSGNGEKRSCHDGDSPTPSSVAVAAAAVAAAKTMTSTTPAAASATRFSPVLNHRKETASSSSLLFPAVVETPSKEEAIAAAPTPAPADPTVAVAAREPNSQLLGAMRLKSGRSDLPEKMRCPSMSCSDKLVRWGTLGMQGLALSRYVPRPVVLSSVVIGSDPRCCDQGRKGGRGRGKESGRKEEEEEDRHGQRAALKRAIADRIARCVDYLYGVDCDYGCNDDDGDDDDDDEKEKEESRMLRRGVGAATLTKTMTTTTKATATLTKTMTMMTKAKATATAMRSVPPVVPAVHVVPDSFEDGKAVAEMYIVDREKEKEKEEEEVMSVEGEGGRERMGGDLEQDGSCLVSQREKKTKIKKKMMTMKKEKGRNRKRSVCSPCGVSLNWQHSPFTTTTRSSASLSPSSSSLSSFYYYFRYDGKANGDGSAHDDDDDGNDDVEVTVGARGIRQGKKPRCPADVGRCASRLSRRRFAERAIRCDSLARLIRNASRVRRATAEERPDPERTDPDREGGCGSTSDPRLNGVICIREAEREGDVEVTGVVSYREMKDALGSAVAAQRRAALFGYVVAGNAGVRPEVVDKASCSPLAGWVVSSDVGDFKV